MFECFVSVDLGINLEVGMVIMEVVGEFFSSKSFGKCCIFSVDIFVLIVMINEGIILLVDNMIEDVVYQFLNNNVYESEYIVFVELENINVVGDYYVSKMVLDVIVGEEFQIRSL